MEGCLKTVANPEDKKQILSNDGIQKITQVFKERKQELITLIKGWEGFSDFLKSSDP